VTGGVWLLAIVVASWAGVSLVARVVMG